MSEQKKRTNTDFVKEVLIALGITLLYILILIAIFGDQDIQFNPDEVPVSMIEPMGTISISEYCQNLKDDFENFKDYLGVGDFLPPDMEVDWADLDYWNRLNQDILSHC